MTDVLRPPDERDLAQNRKVTRPGAATSRDTESASSRASVPILNDPQPQAQPVPQAAPEVPQGQPLPQPVDNTQAPEGFSSEVQTEPPVGRPMPVAPEQKGLNTPGNEGDGLPPGQSAGGLPRMDAVSMINNITYSPTETPLPNISGLAYLQEQTSTFAQASAKADAAQQAVSNQQLIQTFTTTLRPQAIGHAGQYEVDVDNLRTQLHNNRQEAIRIIQENKPGIQDARLDPGGGEVATGASATDNAIEANGRQSETGKGGNWFQRGWDKLKDLYSKEGEQIADMADTAWSFLNTKPAVQRDPKQRAEVQKENKRIMQESKERTKADNNLQKMLEPLAPTPGKNPFNPAKGQYGDFGSVAVVSPAIGLLSLPQNLATAGVLEVTDAIGVTKKPSNDQRNRVVQVLTGRDYSFSGTKNEYNPVSIQQPEGTKNEWWRTAGGLILDVIAGGGAEAAVNRTIRATRNLEKGATEVIQIAGGSGGTPRNIAQATDTAPPKTPSVPQDKPYPDKPASYKDPFPVHTSENTRVADNTKPKPPAGYKRPKDATVKVQPNAITVRTPYSMPEPVRNPSAPVQISIQLNTKPIDVKAAASIIDINSIKTIDLPSGNRLSDRVGSDGLQSAPLTDADLIIHPRTNEDLSTIARNTINPETGKPFLNSYRTLSDAEIARLNDKYGNVFDRYGKPVPDLDNANVIDAGDGQLFEVTRPELSATKLQDIAPSINDIRKLHDEVDELGKQLNRAIEEGSDEVEATLRKLEATSERITRSVKDQPGLYQMYIERGDLPQSMKVTSREGMILGDEFVQTQMALSAQRPVLDQLIDEVDQMKFHLNNTETELSSLRTVGRGDLFNGLTTKEVMGIPQPELRINDYVPKLLPTIDTLPIRPPEANKLLDDNPLWLHGSDSDIGVREHDIMSGGTTSEHGLGIYLTRDQDVADQAALALPQNNRPPRPDSMPGIPTRTTVNTDRLIAPIDLNKPPNAGLRKVFNEAANSVGLPGNYADKLTSTSKAWDEFKVRYHEQIGQVPETVNREFQQKVLVGIQKIGYDSGHFVDEAGNVHLVVYQPHKLNPVGASMPLEAPSITKQIEARAWLDEYTFKSNPSEVSRVNSVRSRLQHQTMTQQNLAEALAKERLKQDELIENYIKLQDELETKRYNDVEKLLEVSEEAAPKLDLSNTIRRNNNPCL